MFVIVGEALLDMVQAVPGGPFVARPGGGPMNVAVGLRRLGHDTALMSRLSAGPLGAIIMAHIARNNLRMDWCVTTNDQTTLAFASLDDQHRAAYEFYVNGTADWGWTTEDLLFPPQAQVLHTGSLSACLLPSADVLLSKWKERRSTGEQLLSYDPNVRPALVADRSHTVRTVEAFVATSHLVKLSEEDLDWLYPDDDIDHALHRLAASGPELVVLTRGPAGCRALRSSGRFLDRPGINVNVVDTIGAGDAFQSGLLSAAADLGALTPGAIKRLSDDDMIVMLDRAVTVSALTCQRAGADPPHRKELAKTEAHAANLNAG